MVEKSKSIKNLEIYINGKNKVHNKMGEIEFVLDKHYTVIDKLGKGAYGQVIKVKDLSQKEKDKQDCAIKKIEDVFDHSIYAKRCLRELKVLRLLQHENVSLLLCLIFSYSLFHNPYN